MLPLPIAEVFLANIRIGEKVMNVMRNLETWKTFFKLGLLAFKAAAALSFGAVAIS